ncbi:putative alcohol dehydrogenase [Colletotrichum karsti]|uniref:Alcohol dehydrogenase n=1 Tax=Colletotrichum karsti TaxID=1095194 RepID=A0A9P6I3Z9_9PEZI|nr:putative alcohol dehydrogenase [Colletotrichum karsti]KAF9876923.1 putative alcohol dehydrogenase [Colletotrichum karsti]
MAYPDTYQAVRRTHGSLPLSVETVTETLPNELGSDDVLIKIHAVSLNFRDVGMLHDRYPMESLERGIVASDCAAEVVAIGQGVQDFRLGDHVVPLFDINDIDENVDDSLAALGGNVDGVLREYAIFEAKHLVRLPEYLSWEEASTLACAGVTAWNALNLPSDASGRNLSALLSGTGGVSMFAVLLCIAAGVQPIITSSSDEKLEAVKKLHPSIKGINYKTTPDIAAEARRITNGRGVDIVINNVGPASVMQDLDALRQKNGHVSLVGFLDGYAATWDQSALLGFMSKRASLRGIKVGSKNAYIRLFEFLEQHKITLTPIIDRVFPFNESRAACDYLYSGKHVGKVVIKI